MPPTWLRPPGSKRGNNRLYSTSAPVTRLKIRPSFRLFDLQMTSASSSVWNMQMSSFITIKPETCIGQFGRYTCARCTLTYEMNRREAKRAGCVPCWARSVPAPVIYIFQDTVLTPCSNTPCAGAALLPRRVNTVSKRLNIFVSCTYPYRPGDFYCLTPKEVDRNLNYCIKTQEVVSIECLS
ncbi:hypothetical protein NA56DRAFT_7436 [Hyaloscypha hepaticicola]|uniref:Uncharacterized protein n=1 Tax=Hyaloscypha hepaticicola TaxID=2082293 RepID=A0A2J6QPU8_9HELO|nr:hypothetical protein NA56DRAFT_7436 [Hyaloscypha hepaticicola]